MPLGILRDVDAGGRMNRYPRRPLKRGLGDSLLHVLGSVVGWIYKMAFGGLDELVYRKNRKQFIAEVEQGFSSLISQHAGKVVPDEGLELPKAFDYVAVTVEFSAVRFRIIRGRGELRVQAALPSDPHDWEDLSLLWSRRVMRECGKPPSIHDRLEEVAQRIDANWNQIVASLAAWQ
jgi:hypothetical protein